MWRDQDISPGKCQTQSVQLFSHRSVTVTPRRALLTSSANQRPVFAGLTNQNPALWHREASFEPGTVTRVMNCAAKMSRDSFMRLGARALYYLLSIWHLTGSLMFHWSWLTLIEPEHNQTKASLLSGNQRELEREFNGRGISVADIPKPVISNSFPFYVGPAMKINMSRIAGEWRMWLRHLAPLKARSSISLYPRSSLSPGSPLYIPGNWDLYKMRRMVPLKMFDSPSLKSRTTITRGWDGAKRFLGFSLIFWYLSYIRETGGEWLGKFDWIQIQVLIEMIPHLPGPSRFFVPCYIYKSISL